MSTQIVEYKPSQAIMEMAEQCKTIAGVDMGIARIFARATKVNAIRTMMAHPEVQKIIIPLAGNPAGFYIAKGDEDVVKNPTALSSIVTEAVSRGARLDGGEFTVMKNRAFLNKPYYQRQLDELGKPGSYTAECPYEMVWWDRREKDIIETGATVQVTIEIEYTLKRKNTGEELKRVESFSCWLRKFSTDTPDKWVGQAERRAFQKLLRKLTVIDFGEDEDGELPPERESAGPVIPVVGKVNMATAPRSRTVVHPPAQVAETVEAQEIKASDSIPMQAAPELAQAVADFAKNIKGEATAVAGPAAPPEPQPQPVAAPKAAVDPLKRFFAVYAALKAAHGLPVCMLVLAEGGYEGKMPSTEVPPEALDLMAERMERILAGKEVPPKLAAPAKGAAPAASKPAAPVGAADVVYPAGQTAAAPGRPPKTGLF